MSDDCHPLGPPTNRKSQEPEERWVADDPAKPHIQRNTKTGAMRSYDPRREAANAPTIWQYFGVAPPIQQPAKCWCRSCNGEPVFWMIVCPDCGDKRCIHASDHEAPCAQTDIYAHNSWVERNLRPVEPTP